MILKHLFRFLVFAVMVMGSSHGRSEGFANEQSFPLGTTVRERYYSEDLRLRHSRLDEINKRYGLDPAPTFRRSGSSIAIVVHVGFDGDPSFDLQSVSLSFEGQGRKSVSIYTGALRSDLRWVSLPISEAPLGQTSVRLKLNAVGASGESEVPVFLKAADRVLPLVVEVQKDPDDSRRLRLRVVRL